MSTETSSPKILPPFTNIEYYIIFVMLNKPRHGLGVFEEVANLTGNQIVLSPGTLYAALKRLYTTGLIQIVTPEGAGYEHDERRKIYQVTEAGVQSFAEQVRWLEQEADRARHELARRQHGAPPQGGAAAESDAAPSPEPDAPDHPTRAYVADKLSYA